MDLKINITTNNLCLLSIQDLKEGYLLENSTSISKGKFKYSDTSSISVLLYNKPTSVEILNPVYTPHINDNPITLDVKLDGWFTLNYIVLPTRTWFEAEKLKPNTSALDLYEVVYFLDGNTIYKYFNNEEVLSSLEEIVLRNPENTTISKVAENYVSVCFLNKCYVSLCLSIFKASGFNPCNRKNQIDSNLIYKRDLLSMAINSIKYLVEFNQLAEAQRLIERVSGCNGLCDNNTITSLKSNCGC